MCSHARYHPLCSGRLQSLYTSQFGPNRLPLAQYLEDVCSSSLEVTYAFRIRQREVAGRDEGMLGVLAVLAKFSLVRRPWLEVVHVTWFV